MIRRVLVADRGETARRIFATCRAVGVETVAVFTEEDIDAPHVREADYAARLPSRGGPRTRPGSGQATAEDAASGYADPDAILAAVRRCGADAVHPGCGNLAEDAAFAAGVLEAGLTWIGPPPDAIEIMGSKLLAKKVMASAGVPVVPQSPAASSALADDQPGMPVLLKPSAGRHGLGIRIVRRAAALDEAIATARQQAAMTFGDPEIVCERYIEGARRVDVQIVADSAGTVVPLGERECSIQRQNQAILDEAPSPAVDPGLRVELFAAATSVARAVNYVGAGTVEFLLAPSGEYYVLEMTPRLQTEHPVTECVFGIDLVRLQLLIAEGGTLPFTGPPPLRGHAIQVRLTAEDPAYDWHPCTGSVRHFEVPGVVHRFGPLLVPGLRLDSAVTEGYTIAPPTDPLLGKVIAWSPTRREAARLLATALANARLHGVATNRDLLVRVLRNPAFVAGHTDTAFLNHHPEVFAPLLSSLDAVNLSCLAAALSGSARRRAMVPPLAGLPPAWRNVPSTAQTAAFDGPTGPMEVGYRFDRSGELQWWAVRHVDREFAGLPREVPGTRGTGDNHLRVLVLDATADLVDLEVNEIRMIFHIHAVPGDPPVCYVDSAEGSVALTELPRFPDPKPQVQEGSLTAPLAGTVTAIMVVPGQRVAAGDLVLTLDGGTARHPVHAPTSGVVCDLWVAAGTPVDAGTPLAILLPEQGQRREPPT